MILGLSVFANRIVKGQAVRVHMVAGAEIIKDRVLNGVLERMRDLLRDPAGLCSPAEIKDVIHGVQQIVFSIMRRLGIRIKCLRILYGVGDLMHESVKRFRDSVHL